VGFDSQRRRRWHRLLHARGQVTVADGTDEMAKRIERVLTTDPGMGIIRHADAGYDEAKEFAEEDRRESADEFLNVVFPTTGAAARLRRV